MFVELPRVRLDGGARAFRQHWGYESRPLAPPPPLIEEDEAAVEPETVSLREANTASPIGEFPTRLNLIQWDDAIFNRFTKFLMSIKASYEKSLDEKYAPSSESRNNRYNFPLEISYSIPISTITPINVLIINERSSGKRVTYIEIIVEKN